KKHPTLHTVIVTLRKVAPASRRLPQRFPLTAIPVYSSPGAGLQDSSQDGSGACKPGLPGSGSHVPDPVEFQATKKIRLPKTGSLCWRSRPGRRVNFFYSDGGGAVAGGCCWAGVGPSRAL